MRMLLWSVALWLVSTAPLVAQDAGRARHLGGTGPDAAYASAVVAGGMIYVSGALGAEAGSTIEAQTRAVLESIRQQLGELGASMEDVVRCGVFMADLSERPRLNEVYRGFFPAGRPARSAVGVSLRGIEGAKVEIDCVAAAPR